MRYPVGISPPNLWLATPIRHQFLLSTGSPQSVGISHFFALTTKIPLFLEDNIIIITSYVYDGIDERKKREPLHYIYYHWYFWYFGNYARKPLVLATSLNTTFGKKLVELVVAEGKTTMRSMNIRYSMPIERINSYTTNKKSRRKLSLRDFSFTGCGLLINE